MFAQAQAPYYNRPIVLTQLDLMPRHPSRRCRPRLSLQTHWDGIQDIRRLPALQCIIHRIQSII